MCKVRTLNTLYHTSSNICVQVSWLYLARLQRYTVCLGKRYVARHRPWHSKPCVVQEFAYLLMLKVLGSQYLSLVAQILLSETKIKPHWSRLGLFTLLSSDVWNEREFRLFSIHQVEEHDESVVEINLFNILVGNSRDEKALKYFIIQSLS